jgi:hypothetical protein
MDVEGAELLAMNGAVGLLSREPAPVLVFECLPALMTRFGYGYADVAAYVRSLGFALCEFTQRYAQTGIQSVGTTPTQPNLVAVRDPAWLVAHLADAPSRL